jgi:hypothetical protein
MTGYGCCIVSVMCGGPDLVSVVIRPSSRGGGSFGLSRICGNLPLVANVLLLFDALIGLALAWRDNRVVLVVRAGPSTGPSN